MCMVRYAYDLNRHRPEPEVFSLVINIGNWPFGAWWRPVQSVPGSHGYHFEEGALLNIHDYAVPVFPVADYPLPPQSLVAGIVALARIQAASRRGGNEAAEQILPLLRAWIIPRVIGCPKVCARPTGPGSRRLSTTCSGTSPNCAASCVKSTTLKRRRRS